MSIQSGRTTDSLIHRHDLTDPPGGFGNLLLDMSSSPWALKDGQASILLGLDVVAIKAYQPDRGRKSIGVSIPEADRPITSVIPVNAEALVAEDVFFFNSLQNDTVLRNHSIILPFSVNTTTGNVAVTYTKATGVITATGAFVLNSIAYNRRSDDKVMVNEPEEIRGLYEILSDSGDGDTITIQANLGASDGNSTVTGVVGHITQGRGLFSVSLVVSGVNRLSLIKTVEEYERSGPWTTDFLNIPILLDEDKQNIGTSSSKAVVTSLHTYVQVNDTVLFPDATTNFDGRPTKVHFIVNKKRNLQGTIVSNGRKFWLQKSGVYTEIMDLGNDMFKGAVWRGTRIANNRLLLVTPGFAPRVYHLSKDTPVTSDETLAGMIAPRQPNETATSEDLENISWLTHVLPTGENTGPGSLTEGNIQVLVRLINLVDEVGSDFVVAPISDDTKLDPTSPADPDGLVSGGTDEDGPAGDKLSVAVGTNDSASVIAQINAGFNKFPPIHNRSTYLEVWRTLSGASRTYFLEKRILVGEKDFNTTFPNVFRIPVGSLFNPRPTAGTAGRSNAPITFKNEDLLRLPVLTRNDRLAVLNPPICKDVVSIGGVTFCFGRANDTVTEPTIKVKGFYTLGASYADDTGQLGVGISMLDNYTWVVGDEFVVTRSHASTAQGFLENGAYPIASKQDNSNLVLASGLVGGDLGSIGVPWQILGYIQRDITIPWTKIKDDEEVWFSRTDRFAPENFLPRILELSRIGDIFRRATKVGRYIVIIMDQGVHLLFNIQGTILKDTVSDTGKGTPWADSVVQIGNQVLWANTEGIQSMSVFSDINNQGVRASIQTFGGQGLGKWFKDAFDLGYNVDAGVDTLNNTIRFRRSEGNNKFQTLQISLRTNRITLLDDDNGSFYVRSRFADTTVKKSEALYSVDSVTGAFFEVNDDSDTYHYANSTVQATLNNDYVVTPTTISHATMRVFESDMVGEIIRFRMPSGDVLRTITKATSDTLTFDRVPDLQGTEGVAFLIGATRVQWKWAHLRGTSPNQVKKIRSVTVRAVSGKRGMPTTPLVIRGYKDFVETLVDTSNMSVFNEGDSGKVSSDRASSLQVDGHALELELENLETRNDFKLEHLEVIVEEERDTNMDQET